MFKLGTFSNGQGATFAGLVFDDKRVVHVSLAATLHGNATSRRSELAHAKSVDDLLGDWERSFDALQELAGFSLAQGLDRVAGLSFDIGELEVAPPVLRPGKLVCHAQNYADHVLEMRKSRFGDEQLDLSKDFMGQKSKTWPYAFLKAPSALTGAFSDIELAQGHPQIDWEAEMALVIGRRGKRVPEGQAMEHVAGFMTFNDVSCRDNQWRPDRVTLRSDWFASKSFDTFAPAGPFMVPRAFVGDHMNLRIKLKVNGELMQDGNTGGLIFSPEEQISFFSQSMSWVPGDMLATGTPAGTGQGLGRFLNAGDVIETEIEGLGVQKNRCVPQP